MREETSCRMAMEIGAAADDFLQARVGFEQKALTSRSSGRKKRKFFFCFIILHSDLTRSWHDY
jgi:hypothetical protein